MEGHEQCVGIRERMRGQGRTGLLWSEGDEQETFNNSAKELNPSQFV